MDTEYYFVAQSILKKQVLITANRSDFKTTPYEFYIKFKFTSPTEIEILSSVHRGENNPIAITLMLEVLTNMFHTIIKKHQKLKLTTGVKFSEDLDLHKQLKKSNIESYLQDGEWKAFPNVEAILNKITNQK